MAGLHEECGVFGIFAPQTMNVAGSTYLGLYALQHRGQESCGIAVCDGGVMTQHRADGLVSEVFTQETLQKLGSGQMAVGHVRYATTGGHERSNIQPLVIRHVKGNLALVHNGDLTNAAALRRSFELSGAIFHGTSDTEAIAYEIVRHRLTCGSTEAAVEQAMGQLCGAFSCIVMTAQKLIAFRDPNGFRPLCLGQMADGAHVIASESCALDAVGASFVRDIDPGEIVIVSSEGVRAVRTHCGKCPTSFCIFEYIYFARPDSVIGGVSVHHARMCAGHLLAQHAPVDADVVIGVPDSGLDAALGYAQESGIPYGIGFIKNKYIGRSFIQPEQSMRENAVRIKLNVIRETVEGKRVVMIDDSIVRGTTITKIIRLLRDAGAAEVHVRISSPPFLHGCYFGTDIASETTLIADRYHDADAIAAHIGADSLAYLPVESLGALIGQTDGFCKGCFTGDYPVDVSGARQKSIFDQKIK